MGMFSIREINELGAPASEQLQERQRPMEFRTTSLELGHLQMRNAARAASRRATIAREHEECVSKVTPQWTKKEVDGVEIFTRELKVDVLYWDATAYADEEEKKKPGKWLLYYSNVSLDEAAEYLEGDDTLVKIVEK